MGIHLERVFHSVSNDIVGLAAEERLEMDQTIKNGRIRLNSVARSMFNNTVDHYMIEGIFGIKNHTYNDQLIVCVFVKWADYAHSENTWESLSELEINEAYHRILEENRDQVMDLNEGFMVTPGQ